MFSAFQKYITGTTSNPLTKSELELIESAFTPKKIKRKQFFLQEGDVCKHFAFIVKGAMRQYFVDEKGVEHMIRLGVENWWMGDRESWVMAKPSMYNIDAWEDTDMLLITRADTLDLAHKIPVFNEMVRGMDERYNIATQRRITSAISFTAEKRYADFIESHPEFLQRFPQHIIASYLGITKDTLSRVRKQAGKK
jgi:CRP-like cAMP-binding protein